ncbi:hypothetical protein [Roseovarius sp. D22-M7]|uniref:hypothetical protein n=1 Tax=Roseovarius sp. D22-M7 TaxID=3127116 RepID=UPI003010119D
MMLQEARDVPVGGGCEENGVRRCELACGDNQRLDERQVDLLDDVRHEYGVAVKTGTFVQEHQEKAEKPLQARGSLLEFHTF